MARVQPVTVVPESHYRDTPAAIAFLERAFGFVPSLVVRNSGDDIDHAELWLGGACVMLSSLREDGWDYRTPGEIGGVNTGAPYLALPDIDAAFARAKSAGAQIVTELAATEYGSRDFSVRDPEGFLWFFGTYRPSAEGSADGAHFDAAALYAGARYHDAPAAIAWLGRAFGFEPGLVVPGETPGEIAHAQLHLGSAVVMLGSARTDEYRMQTPLEIGGYTQSLNVAIDDPDAHHARARSAGAHILREPADSAYGSRSYVARDPAGYIWNFGTYRPQPPAPRNTR